MIEVVKHKQNAEYVERYYLRCNCGCHFIADWNECKKMSKAMEKARIVFVCPECGTEVETTRHSLGTLLEYKNENLKNR